MIDYRGFGSNAKQKYFGNVIFVLFFGFWLERNASIFRVIVKMKSLYGLECRIYLILGLLFWLLSRGSFCSL